MNLPKKPAEAVTGRKKWGVMSRLEKTVFVLKVCLMVCSGGFIYANVLAP
jgi:hypothetical protein